MLKMYEINVCFSPLIPSLPKSVYCVHSVQTLTIIDGSKLTFTISIFTLRKLTCGKLVPSLYEL